MQTAIRFTMTEALIDQLNNDLSGWEDLTADQKEFICFRRFLGNDKETCRKIGDRKRVTLAKVKSWRESEDFCRLEKHILAQPMVLANALFSDLLPIAAFSLYRTLTGDNERAVESAAKTVFRIKGLLGDDQRSGDKVVVISLPFERDNAQDRLGGSVHPALGPGSSTQVIEADQGT